MTVAPSTPVPDHAGPSPTLPITGERTVPGIPEENYWFMRHVIAYRWAAARARGAVVVDAGCGEGYGTQMLARTAADVTGVELVPDVVAHARAAYPGHRFVTADICDTGLATDSVDTVVNLQVIEHLPDVGRFLGEVRRILRPGGEFVVATPNRLTFTPHNHEPTNVFHVEEFTATELTERLEKVGGFEVTTVLGVHHGQRIAAVAAATGRSFTDLVLADPAGWPTWLRRVVAGITTDNFELIRAGIEQSLDLLVVARAPR